MEQNSELFLNVHFLRCFALCIEISFVLSFVSMQVSKIRRRNPEYCSFNSLGISSPLWINEMSNWPPAPTGGWKLLRSHHELALNDSIVLTNYYIKFSQTKWSSIYPDRIDFNNFNVFNTFFTKRVELRSM